MDLYLPVEWNKNENISIYNMIQNKRLTRIRPALAAPH
jgi:hypothetical protein